MQKTSDPKHLPRVGYDVVSTCHSAPSAVTRWGLTSAGLSYHLLERVLSLHNDIHSAGQRVQTVAAILRSRMPLGALSCLAPLSDMIQQLSQQKVIWAILPTNMGHITHQYGPYYSPTPAILLTHPQPLPEGGGLKGSTIRHIRLISLIRPISPKNTPPPLGGLKGGLLIPPRGD